MNENAPFKHMPAPLGGVEPHAQMLNIPPDEQLLYKIISVDNLLRSIIGKYLHFSRVDCYADLLLCPQADPHDGRQLPKDEQGNESTKFEKSPDFSAADYYNQSRARTYACCFSLENSNYIWNNYANGCAKGKVCIVFNFGKLRAKLNQTLQNSALAYNGNLCHQIFSVNYGIIEYVEWDSHQANEKHLPNPIKYIYLKDKKFSEEKELRISLSALGIGQFALKDGNMMQFPPSLQVDFDFRSAIIDNTIKQILYAPDSDSNFIREELHKLQIVPIESK